MRGGDPWTSSACTPACGERQREPWGSGRGLRHDASGANAAPGGPPSGPAPCSRRRGVDPEPVTAGPTGRLSTGSRPRVRRRRRHGGARHVGVKKGRAGTGGSGAYRFAWVVAHKWGTDPKEGSDGVALKTLDLEIPSGFCSHNRHSYSRKSLQTYPTRGLSHKET